MGFSTWLKKHLRIKINSTPLHISEGKDAVKTNTINDLKNVIMDGKVMTKETKSLLIKMGDDLIKAPIWAEPFDGLALKWLIDFIDKKGDQFIPDEVDPHINNAVVLAFAGDYKGAATSAATAMNMVIDIPLIGEDAEQIVFVNGIKFIIGIVQSWISKRNG